MRCDGLGRYVELCVSTALVLVGGGTALYKSVGAGEEAGTNNK